MDESAVVKQCMNAKKLEGELIPQWGHTLGAMPPTTSPKAFLEFYNWPTDLGALSEVMTTTYQKGNSVLIMRYILVEVTENFLPIVLGISTNAKAMGAEEMQSLLGDARQTYAEKDSQKIVLVCESISQNCQKKLLAIGSDLNIEIVVFSLALEFQRNPLNHVAVPKYIRISAKDLMEREGLHPDNIKIERLSNRIMSRRKSTKEKSTIRGGEFAKFLGAKHGDIFYLQRPSLDGTFMPDYRRIELMREKCDL